MQDNETPRQPQEEISFDALTRFMAMLSEGIRTLETLKPFGGARHEAVNAVRAWARARQRG